MFDFFRHKKVHTRFALVMQQTGEGDEGEQCWKSICKNNGEQKTRLGDEALASIAVDYIKCLRNGAAEDEMSVINLRAA